MALPDCTHYRPCQPRATPLYRLVDARYDEVREQWEERFETRCGFWRSLTDNSLSMALAHPIIALLTPNGRHPRALDGHTRRFTPSTTEREFLSLIDNELLLARATSLRRVLVTSDHDFLAITDRWADAGRVFAGIVYVHPLRVSIGLAVKDLELVARAGDASDLAGRVEFLPIRRRH